MIKMKEDRSDDRHKRNLVLGSECQSDTNSETKIVELKIVETNEEPGFVDPYRDEEYNPWS